jgi:hypothetical protein
VSARPDRRTNIAINYTNLSATALSDNSFSTARVLDEGAHIRFSLAHAVRFADCECERKNCCRCVEKKQNILPYSETKQFFVGTATTNQTGFLQSEQK